MTATVAILVPVVTRPRNVGPLIDSIAESTSAPWSVLFLTSPGFPRELAAIQEVQNQHPDGTVAVAEMEQPPGPGDYARKINAGVALTPADVPYLFFAADDLRFHPGWLEAALDKMTATIGVVGVNDLGPWRPNSPSRDAVAAGEHATHCLVARWYTQLGLIDDPAGGVLNPAYHHEFCNPPEAPVWMGDLSFRHLGDVAVGDEVVGWERYFTREDQKHSLNRLVVAKVKRVKRRVAPIVRVTLASGRVIRCTPDHQWLNPRWQSTRDSLSAQYRSAKVGRPLLHVVDEPEPVPPELQRTAGWLGGIYDGEGSWIEIAQCPIANPAVHIEIQRSLDRLGIPYTVNSGKQAHHITLTGGRQGYLNFLSRCQPVKRESIAGRIIGGRRFGHRDDVVAIEHDGEGEVVSMTTSTGNYVVWGYASKNCDDEFTGTARHRDAWAYAENSHVEHLHPRFGKGTMDASYRASNRRIPTGRRIYRSRAHLWGEDPPKR